MMIEFLFLLLRPNPKCNIFSGKINKSFSSYVLLSNSDIHTEADNIYPIRYSGHIGVGEASLRPYLYACLCVSFSFRALVSSFKDSRRQLLSHLAFFSCSVRYLRNDDDDVAACLMNVQLYVLSFFLSC